MLKFCHTPGLIEAGCDEAGRGCLCGPVFCAAVILPPHLNIEGLDDSKKLSESKRESLRTLIEEKALAWAVEAVGPEEIDQINILNASIEGMHRALAKLEITPRHIIVDGNRFKPFRQIPFTTIIKGDGKYMSIAAASILAKTHRDEYMRRIHEEFPEFEWEQNKGYPTKRHKEFLLKYGPNKYHRKTFLKKILNCYD